MIPMRVSIEFEIDEPSTDDIDDLDIRLREAIEDIIGEVDSDIVDFGLQFELQD